MLGLKEPKKVTGALKVNTATGIDGSVASVLQHQLGMGTSNLATAQGGSEGRTNVVERNSLGGIQSFCNGPW